MDILKKIDGNGLPYRTAFFPESDPYPNYYYTSWMKDSDESFKSRAIVAYAEYCSEIDKYKSLYAN